MKSLLIISILVISLYGCGSSSEVMKTNEENIVSTTDELSDTTNDGKLSIENEITNQKELSQDSNAAVGTWELTTETPRGTRKSTLVISETDGKLTGKTDNGTFNIKQKGNALSWNSSMDTPMGAMTLEHQVEIDGNKMTGNAKMSSGPMAGRSMSIAGVRK